MHWSDHDRDAFCLTYNSVSAIKSSVYQQINYCLRDDYMINLLQHEIEIDSIHQQLNFSYLKQNNITVNDLIRWSALIETAERYQLSLVIRNDETMSSNSMSEIFYNCTSPWFGPGCRLMFDPPRHLSFDQLLLYQLSDRKQLVKDPSITCYTHLNCEKPSPCLDWREICDSKIDCLDGADERHCWLADSNECAVNEFRCQNGQCIPKEFFNDDPENADCLDGSDEPQQNFPYGYCIGMPDFRCEELSCKRDLHNFPCGDGYCAVPGTADCANGRDSLFSDDQCLQAVACLMKMYDITNIFYCPSFCNKMTCDKIKETYCPPLFQYPSTPLLFGHIKFLFTNEPAILEKNEALLPEYICFDAQRCSTLSSNIFHLFNLSCIRTRSLDLPKRPSYIANMRSLRKALLECSNNYNCNLANIYACQNSTKCISKYQRNDGIQDCPFNDDEILNHNDNQFKSSQISIDPSMIESTENQIHFSQICDGFVNLNPLLIDGKYETDETDCDYWPCNNTYTRCNKFWSCDDGADEVNCPPSTCPPFEHPCVFFNDTTTLSCLPISRTGDGKIDCVGGTDEPYICRQMTPIHWIDQHFTCGNETKCIFSYQLCRNDRSCSANQENKFCENFPNGFDQLCESKSSKTDVQRFFCDTITGIEPKIGYLTVNNVPQYPTQKIVDKPTSILSSSSTTRRLLSNYASIDNSKKMKWRCHRGIRILVRVNVSSISDACLCPPSYYGDKCQYQNDRISLTVRFQATWNWRDIFLFVITLIDDEHQIESYDLIEYLPIRDCDTKYNLYLQFAKRWKNNSRNYSIKIDSISRLSGVYRASWIFPIQFLFLPVYRLSTIVTIPHADMETITKCPKSCFHGRCYQYANAPHLTFCRCDSGWSGVHCDRPIQCNCTSNAHCLDPSICLCPLDRFGPHCHLLRTSCLSEHCINGGQCVQSPQFLSSIQQHQPTCICPEQYSGDRCQYHQSRIEVQFHPSIDIPPYMLIHFITANEKSEPFRSSTLKKIPFDHDTVFLYVSHSFHIAMVQLMEDFYLIIIREQAIVSATIVAQIHPFLRCLPIANILSEKIIKQHLLKRIKYYHQPCIQNHQLACFYDDIHICVCEQGRQANCFRFEHNMTFDCLGSAVCENGGQCFLDRPVCPTTGNCICQDCYYGSKCQFSTKGSSLSLDTILGYQFIPHSNFGQQSLAVRMTLCFVIVVLILGLVNNTCSLITFRTKTILDNGCGQFLLASTITSIIIIVILAVKFGFLYAWKTGYLQHIVLIRIQCILIDYFLRLLLATQDWLYACVAIERMMVVLQGVKFKKAKSRQFAKWIIIIIFSLTGLTYIHEPIHRQIIDDADDQRTWCVTNYSDSLISYDRAMNIVHFSVPFITNLLSGIIITVSSAHRHRTTHKQVIFRELCLKETRNHKHLLISPFLLVLLALPRLIISFLSGCMKTGRNPWLYLIGYFISFLPPICIFLVFVLPSEMYKQEFHKSLRNLWLR